MNIYSDKTIYKLTTGVILIISFFMLALAAITGGLKMFLFVVWLMLAVIIFLSIVSLVMFQKGLLSSSKNLLTRITGGLIDFHLFNIFSVALAIFLGFLSVGVWIYLDQKLPTLPVDTAPLSQIPSSIEKLE